MQHEEQDPRHPNHWEHQRQHRHPHHREHFHDFRSRWGEPMPATQQQRWHPEETDRFAREARYNREEWLPEQQRYQPRRIDQHHHRMEEQHPPQEPLWRQRDVHFDPSNQRVEDRWFEDPLMPHPRRRAPRHYDGFWQDYED
ncbi:hypothetical protein [Pontibacter anaerobius]|uniref:Uncharacterized protein n=1 Tax=Pontibacter anaerobius TaxID=2993940 RepID=A0ABT3RI20_9BACT|nr:hypothetical protein [Pontibacter anaerobius]MCX2741267.1 hypothetical protein [Pontibacter anaerobius]